MSFSIPLEADNPFFSELINLPFAWRYHTPTIFSLSRWEARHKGEKRMKSLKLPQLFKPLQKSWGTPLGRNIRQAWSALAKNLYHTVAISDQSLRIFICVSELALFLKLQHVSPNGNVLALCSTFALVGLHKSHWYPWSYSTSLICSPSTVHVEPGPPCYPINYSIPNITIYSRLTNCFGLSIAPNTINTSLALFCHPSLSEPSVSTIPVTCSITPY